MTVRRVELPVGDDSMQAFLAEPAAEGRRGSLLVVHEWWGLNGEIEEQARRFAAEGFLTLAVDLYDGEVTTDAARAMELVNKLQTATAMVQLQAAQTWLSTHPRSNGRVGVTGFCLGGAMALAAAGNVKGLSAVVPFYGTPREDFLRPEKMRAPIQGHYAKQDPFVAPERPPAIAERVRAAGGSMELFFYDANHAFMRKGDPQAYHEESARLAWSRATAFLHEKLDG